MPDSSFDMSAAGRSPLLALWLLLALTVALALAVSGPADAQTPTTVALPTAATGASLPAATAAAVTTTAAARAGDAASTRTVNRIVAVLVGLAALLLGVAIWFWRSTKPLPRHLDGLDLMGTRPWRESDSSVRAVLLAPVHERRGEERADDLVAPPERSEAPMAPPEEPEVVAVEEVVIVADDADADADVDGEVAVAADPADEVAAPSAPRVS